MEPIHDTVALFCGKQLVHDHLSIVLHITAIPANHAIKTNIPNLLIDLCPAAAGADIYLVAVSPGLANSLYRRGRQNIVIIHQGAIYIYKYNLAHIFHSIFYNIIFTKLFYKHKLR